MAKIAYEASRADNIRENESIKPVAHLVITKVIREVVPIEHNSNGKGFGQVVDEFLTKCAFEGEEVQKFELEIDAEYWGEYAHNIRQDRSFGMAAK